MYSCKCLNVFCPTQRVIFSRDPSLLCSENSVRENNSADADSKLYDLNHIFFYGKRRFA